MSENEIKKNEAVEQEQNDGLEDIMKAVFGEEAMRLEDKTGETEGRDENEADGFEGFLELMAKAAAEHHDEIGKKIRREAKDSIMLGMLCGLGVVSLIGAAVSGVWVPVAVGLGICLSGAAAVLVHKGLVVLRA